MSFIHDEIILSSNRDAELVLDAIYNPVAPNEKLEAAATNLLAEM